MHPPLIVITEFLKTEHVNPVRTLPWPSASMKASSLVARTTLFSSLPLTCIARAILEGFEPSSIAFLNHIWKFFHPN